MPFSTPIVNDERKEKYMTVYTFATPRKTIFNTRIADITFLCDMTIHTFGIDMNLDSLVSIFSLSFCFRKETRVYKIRGGKKHITYV